MRLSLTIVLNKEKNRGDMRYDENVYGNNCMSRTPCHRGLTDLKMAVRI